jgi:hypothetical protein
MYTAAIIALVSLCSIQLQAQEKTRDWTAFSQKTDMTTTKKKKFKVSPSVKVAAADMDGKAGLWLRVDNKKTTMRFF